MKGYTLGMETVSEHDRRIMRLVGKACRRLDLDTGWGTERERAFSRALVDTARREDGRCPIEREEPPSELWFYAKAKALGFL